MLDALQVKQLSRELGFDLCGIAGADGAPRLARLAGWIDRGYAEPGPRRPADARVASIGEATEWIERMDLLQQSKGHSSAASRESP